MKLVLGTELFSDSVKLVMTGVNTSKGFPADSDLEDMFGSVSILKKNVDFMHTQRSTKDMLLKVGAARNEKHMSNLLRLAEGVGMVSLPKQKSGKKVYFLRKKYLFAEEPKPVVERKQPEMRLAHFIASEDSAEVFAKFYKRI